MLRGISPVVAEGLVYRRSRVFSPNASASANVFHFVHDRVHEAALAVRAASGAPDSAPTR